ncbi:MAG: hypothetical protein GF364_06535 [Candidatus Lokiarchaeota archaeon]|nr:hypothetical protein [Candidatus Lokiarchaeota archaeon]
MVRMYCNNCDRIVRPNRNFNFCLFMFLLIVTAAGIIFIIPAIVGAMALSLYLIYFFLLKRVYCPICKQTDLSYGPPRTATSKEARRENTTEIPKHKINMISSDHVSKQALVKKVCRNCYNPLKGRFCKKCGTDHGY